MSVRETINGKKSLGLAAGAVLLVVSGILIVTQLKEFTPSLKGKTSFTVDDGKTYFYDDLTKLAPFDKDGKKTARAHVFKCGDKVVVGFVSRYTEESIAAINEAAKYRGTGKPPPNVGILAAIGTTGQELKRPGDAKWLKQGDPKSTEIRRFKCPDGTVPEEMEPE